MVMKLDQSKSSGFLRVTHLGKGKGNPEPGAMSGKRVLLPHAPHLVSGAHLPAFCTLQL